MNLMFRKNFRDGGKSGGGGGGVCGSGNKLTSKVNRSQGKRSRDMSYGNLDSDVHYRTHLFFAPTRGANSNDCEGLCCICNSEKIKQAWMKEMEETVNYKLIICESVSSLCVCNQ